MKKIIIATFVLFDLIQHTHSLKAENLSQLTELLSSNVCIGCDLNNAGLVGANLTGAHLNKANLSNANLSGANLSNADLSGSDLSGASLNSANLTGANLTGANLTGTDLRSSYLTRSIISGNQLQSAYIQGAVGIPQSAGTKDLFYSWGVMEMNKGNYKGATEYYNKTLVLDPAFAKAHLGKAFCQMRLGDYFGAEQEAKIASDLFKEQKNKSGLESSQDLIKNIEIASKPAEVKPPDPNFLDFVENIAIFALQFVRF